jgi:leucyl aminopeptidase
MADSLPALHRIVGNVCLSQTRLDPVMENHMYQTIKLTSPSGKKINDAVAVALFTGNSKLPDSYQQLDDRAGGALTKALKRPEFSAKAGALTCLYPESGPKHLFVLGLGKSGKLKPDKLRTAAAKLLHAADSAQIKNLTLLTMPGIESGLKAKKASLDADAVGRALADGLMLANFTFDDFKGTAAKGQKSKKSATKLNLSVTVDKEIRNAFSAALSVAKSANLARQLAATPPNVANPAYLVAQSRKLARKAGLKCTIIDNARAKKLKMGGLVAVGQAGSTPPALIILQYPGKGKSKSDKPILLVGKAITFDTGGYSMKPPSGMLGMKYDKCGGCAVIGAMQAIAKLKPNKPVIGIIATAENMVDKTAYRPNDIISFCNGVTCEVTNTDAEGRLVLADALAYGCKTYKPAAVIDMATLTGGCVVALGPYSAGLFCNDAKLRSRLFDAADDTGERVWNLPLWEEHRDMMRGRHADILNSSTKMGRQASPIQGAAFLSFLATAGGDPTKPGSIPWAHIDIAGVSDTAENSPMCEPGPTGYGVRLVTRVVEQWK